MFNAISAKKTSLGISIEISSSPANAFIANEAWRILSNDNFFYSLLTLTRHSLTLQAIDIKSFPSVPDNPESNPSL